MPSVFIKTYGLPDERARQQKPSPPSSSPRVIRSPSPRANADVKFCWNTCSVRDFAEQKAINKMKNLVGTARKDNPNQILGYMGCMAQKPWQGTHREIAGTWISSSARRNFIARRITLTRLFPANAKKSWTLTPRGKSEATIREHLFNGQRQDVRVRVRQHHARLQSILHLLHRALTRVARNAAARLMTSSPNVVNWFRAACGKSLCSARL